MALHQKQLLKRFLILFVRHKQQKQEETYITKVTGGKKLTKKELDKLVDDIEVEMKEAAKALRF